MLKDNCSDVLENRKIKVRKTYAKSYTKSKEVKPDSEENRNLAFNWGLKYLSYRPRGVKEVYNYLLRKNFVEDTINSVLKRLIDMKFLDDKNFAKLWIESRQKHKGKSRFIIKNELRLKGLGNDIIEPLLKEATDDFEIARALFEKQKNKLRKFSPEEFKKKIAGFLQRRGFSYETIEKLFRDRRF